jgi:hypothetical protein
MPGWHFTSIVISILLLIFCSNPSTSQVSISRGLEPIPNQGGWVIVQKQAFTGYPITIGNLGSALDSSEREIHQLFYGGVDLTKLLYPFQTPITGFVSAEFYESESGDPFVVIVSINSGRRQTRIARIKQVNIDALRQHVNADSETVTVSADRFAIEAARDIRTITTRQKAEILVGDRLTKGHLLPTADDGILYVALRDGSTAQINPSRIDRLTIKRSIVGQVMGSTVGRGIQGTLTGGVAGLFAGLSIGRLSAIEEMKAGAMVGSIVGLGIGFLDGIFNAEGSKTYELRPAIQREAFELYLTMGF